MFLSSHSSATQFQLHRNNVGINVYRNKIFVCRSHTIYHLSQKVNTFTFQLQILTDELALSEGSSDKDVIEPHPTQVTAINTNEPKDIPKITTPL